MKYLITGGCGFMGSNLAAEVLKRNKQLVVFDNLCRYATDQNLAWLRKQGEFRYIHGDIRNRDDVERVVKNSKPEVVFHLAGQVAMTTSIANPRIDFEVNALGTLNLLEAVRQYSPDAAVIYSSTNKVYGDLEWMEYQETPTRYVALGFPNGFPEDIPLDFHSPYGCSKGAADQYMLDYAHIFGLRTVVFRHSSMYGERQFSSYDQGWIGWFCQKAVETKLDLLKEPFTISGNGKQVRDVLYADDVIALYFATVNNIERVKGQAFNIGGGMDNSLSLLELFTILERELNVELNYIKLSPRESDQRVFIADITKAKRLIGWSPKTQRIVGITKMIKWVESNWLSLYQKP